MWGLTFDTSAATGLPVAVRRTARSALSQQARQSFEVICDSAHANRVSRVLVYVVHM